MARLLMERKTANVHSCGKKSNKKAEKFLAFPLSFSPPYLPRMNKVGEFNRLRGGKVTVLILLTLARS
jgi:hypothetical protein